MSSPAWVARLDLGPGSLPCLLWNHQWTLLLPPCCLPCSNPLGMCSGEWGCFQCCGHLWFLACLLSLVELLSSCCSPIGKMKLEGCQFCSVFISTKFKQISMSFFIKRTRKSTWRIKDDIEWNKQFQLLGTYHSETDLAFMCLCKLILAVSFWQHHVLQQSVSNTVFSVVVLPSCEDFPQEAFLRRSVALVRSPEEKRAL